MDSDTKESRKERLAAVTPWVEKYRPKTMTEIVYQDEVVSVLKKCLTGSDVPNLLFYGPPGTGKTSTILALAKEMFGTLFRDRVLELNASDERGISVIRERVKAFSLETVTAKKSSDGKVVPKIKLVILDECDSMTGAAQAALRRTMEKESASTRFCLICNYVSRIIEPIASRCTKFRFKPLKKELIEEKLKTICHNEAIETADHTVLKEVVNISEGDLRKAITLLHTLFRLKVGESGGSSKSKGSTSSDKQVLITFEDVREVSGYISDRYVRKLIELARGQSVEKLVAFAKDMVYDGYSVAQFLIQLHEWTLLGDEQDLEEEQKAMICEKIAEVDHCLLDGANEYLQLLALAVGLSEILSS